jgi:GTP-binding protein HflX
LHENPREQWDRHAGCPSFENPEDYRAFREWRKEPNVPPRQPHHTRGSRKRPTPFRAKRTEDSRKLDRPAREVAGRLRPERAVLVQVILPGVPRGEAAESLAELERLADTAGATVVGSIVQRRSRPAANTFVGAGKLRDIQALCVRENANAVIFDNELSSGQVNGVDMALGIKVIDRTELILQIFARRARTEEAKLQVELAQLEHMRTRIPHQGQPRFRGGIGMRGPGETPLQLRRGRAKTRIKLLEKRLEQIRQQRERTRQRRPLPAVCLVGYTNAGKSTLLNALSSAHAYVDDRLFATLDTKTRSVHLDAKTQVLVSDTVGFIRHLPHGLVASFRSTLEEATEADLLLVVADAAHPRVTDHLSVVSETLREIGAADIPSFVLLNKCDRPDAGNVLHELRTRVPDAWFISAKTREGLDDVKVAIRAALTTHAAGKLCETT